MKSSETSTSERVDHVPCDLDGLKNLHVQSFFYATDATGLELIKPALRCYDNRADAIRRGEMGLAKGVLEAGYNIAVTDKFWQGNRPTHTTHFRASNSCLVVLSQPFM